MRTSRTVELFPHVASVRPVNDVNVIERIRQVKPTEKNVGGTERLVRATVGPALIVVGVASLGGVLSLAAGTVGVVLAAVLVLAGARMTFTAITQKCYVNALLGRNTCRLPESRREAAVNGDG